MIILIIKHKRKIQHIRFRPILTQFQTTAHAVGHYSNTIVQILFTTCNNFEKDQSKTDSRNTVESLNENLYM